MNTMSLNGLLSIDDDAKKWVDDTLGRLSLDQKIGQLMVFPHYGTFVTPDVVSLIRNQHISGLRIAQKFAPGSADSRNPARASKETPDWRKDVDIFDRPAQMDRINCSASEFAAALNELREIAMESNAGVPLHTAFDQEGEGADFLFEQRLYPFPMGLAASGDPDLAYRVALALGRQTRALGANMIHSPVLDVNTRPDNPEIGPRSYGDHPDALIPYALASLKGFNDSGIAATGKHFPGRGHSDTDAHFGLPEISLDRATLMETHLAPFKALIDAGLPCIMAAFTAYPALGADGIPAATSRAIVTDLLRGELGFKGVVTTDNVQMGGLLSKYSMGEAVVRCLIAGCDLVLCRAYNHQRHEVLQSVKLAVAENRYTEAALDESVGRILAMRWKMGIVENGGVVDAAKAGAAFYETEFRDLAMEAAARSTVVVRDRTGALPISRESKVLLIEQVHHFHEFINNSYIHPGLLWEEMRAHSDNVAVVAVKEKMTDADGVAALRRLAEADIIISTSYYNYRSHAIMVPFLEELRQSGKPLIVISNTPYTKFGIPDWVDTGIVTFCASGRESLRVVAEILFGKRKASATLPITRL